MFIGLMGVKSDNTLVTPGGKELFKVPIGLRGASSAYNIGLHKKLGDKNDTIVD